LGVAAVNVSAMDFDDLFSSKPKDPLDELAKQDLGPLSLDELAHRIEALKVEIARVEAHRDEAAAHRSAADDLFKR
jgi:uncharacterized small protein (DUF1192 family)